MYRCMLNRLLLPAPLCRSSLIMVCQLERKAYSATVSFQRIILNIIQVSALKLFDRTFLMFIYSMKVTNQKHIIQMSSSMSNQWGEDPLLFKVFQLIELCKTMSKAIRCSVDQLEQSYLKVEDLLLAFFFKKKIHVAAVNMPCLQSEIKRLWLRFSAITKVNISFWLVVLNFYLWVLSQFPCLKVETQYFLCGTWVRCRKFGSKKIIGTKCQCFL